MTDNRFDLVCAEIKRLRKEVKDNIAELGNSESERIGLFNDLEIYDNVLSFIDSMKKEPTVSVWHDKEEKPNPKKRIFAICVLDKTFAGYYYDINPRYIRRWAYVEDLIKL